MALLAPATAAEPNGFVRTIRQQVLKNKHIKRKREAKNNTKAPPLKKRHVRKRNRQQ